MSIPNPVPGGRVMNNFGACRGTNCSRRHMGVDILANEGSPILAAVAGKVVKTGTGGLGGNSVWVAGSDGRFYYYAHLRDVLVQTGQILTSGSKLGTVGTTGDAAGGAPHLHFSINGRVGAENPVVDPYTVIDSTQRFGAAAGLAGSLTTPNSSNLVAPGAAAKDQPSSTRRQCSGCLLKINLPVVSDACLLSNCQGQAIVGGAAMVMGGMVMLTGALVLVAYSLKGLGAKAAIASVPGGSLVAGAVTPSGRQARADKQAADDVRAAEQSARMTAAQNRQESAERKIIGRRQTSSPGPRSETPF